MRVFFLLAGVLLQGGVTASMFYLRGHSHIEVFQDDFVAFLLPSVVGFGLFLKGFSSWFSPDSEDYWNPMALGASLVASILVMVITIALCIRYLGA